jgi:hypothetical protein
MLPSFQNTGYVWVYARARLQRACTYKASDGQPTGTEARSMNHETSAPGASARWLTRRVRSEAAATTAYRGARFSEVWNTVLADPYDALPHKRLGLANVPELLSKGIYRAARRTLETRADLLPTFDKLVHCLGICLRGRWQIDASTRYTGLFKTGASGLIVARASDALGEYRPGKLRFMGLAGKLFATDDPDHAAPLPTANFFTLENLSGTHTRHFVDATLSTDLLPLWPHPGIVAKWPLGVLAGPAFMLADRALSPTQAMIRQLYPIAELGEWERSDAVAPQVMRLVPSAQSRRVTTSDLREELRMEHHPGGLHYDIEVSDQRSYFVATGFRRIGGIHLTESVASYSGDHRLHFAHPPYRHRTTH